MPFPWPPALCRQEGLEAIGKALEDTIWGEAGGKGGISKATSRTQLLLEPLAMGSGKICGRARQRGGESHGEVGEAKVIDPEHMGERKHCPQEGYCAARQGGRVPFVLIKKARISNLQLSN